MEARHTRWTLHLANRLVLRATRNRDFNKPAHRTTDQAPIRVRRQRRRAPVAGKHSRWQAPLGRHHRAKRMRGTNPSAHATRPALRRGSALASRRLRLTCGSLRNPLDSTPGNACISSRYPTQLVPRITTRLPSCLRDVCRVLRDTCHRTSSYHRHVMRQWIPLKQVCFT